MADEDGTYTVPVSTGQSFIDMSLTDNTRFKGLIEGQTYTVTVYNIPSNLVAQYYQASNFTNYHNIEHGLVYTFVYDSSLIPTIRFGGNSVTQETQVTPQIMLVRGTYTAETMPAYQPFDDTLVNSKVKRVLSTGKNLWDGTYTNGVALSQTGGTYIDSTLFTSDFVTILPNNQYYISNVNWYNFYDYNKNFILQEGGNVITAPANAAYLRFTTAISNGYDVMLCYGSSALPYQPYISDDTFGVDLEMTGFGEIDNITKQFTEYGSANVITLNGSEAWQYEITTAGNGRFYVYQPSQIDGGASRATQNNTASNWIDVTANQTYYGVAGLAYDGEKLLICNPAYTSVSDFQAWLSANPIQLIYRLDTPRIQTTVDIPAGYSAHKGGLQQQVIEGDYLPYILTKNYPISMAAQTASLMEVDRKQSTLINKNTADIAQKATEIAANTEAINKITDGRTTVGNSKKFDEKTSDNFALISGSYSAMSVGYATSAGSASSAETADNANNASKADTAKNYSLDGTIKQKFDSIEERLSSLGFKQGSISLASGFNATQNTVTRQGNYIIGSLSLDGAGKVISGTSGSFNLGTIPSNFRPKTTVRCGVMFNRSSVTQITHGEPLYAIIGTNGTITVYWERAATSNYSSRIYLTGLNFGYEANSL